MTVVGVARGEQTTGVRRGAPETRAADKLWLNAGPLRPRTLA